MSRLLLITTLDVRARSNNREHHVIARLGPRFEGVTVVYRRRGRTGAGVRAWLAGRTERIDECDVRYVGVDPPLNPPEGTARHLAMRTGRRWPGLVRAAGAAFDTVAILRDALTIRALHDAATEAVSGVDVGACEAFGPWAAAAAIRLRRNGTIRHFAYVDRDFEPGFMTSGLRRRWAVRAEAGAAAAADLTLSIGGRLAGRARLVRGASVALSPTGVDAARFHARVRESPGDRLVFVGRVTGWSGLEEVLGAMALLAGGGAAPHLRILGPVDPGYDAVLRREIIRLGLSERVDWRGDVPWAEIPAALDRADIGLATFRPNELRRYAAPLKVLEYMASGLPVIAVDGSEAADLVQATGTGLACGTNAPDIAAAITAMRAAPDAYRAMSRAGPAAARARDWCRVLDLEAALLAALDGPRGRARTAP